ncbi:MAG TPA: hypothetical protein DC049_00075, partial [Spirochaetia bacterium]|nr:hypothetical protein [Spirochaetia bacterium]
NFDSLDALGKLNKVPQLQVKVAADPVNPALKYLRVNPGIDSDPATWEQRTFEIGKGPVKIKEASFQYYGENPVGGIKIRKVFFIKK